MHSLVKRFLDRFPTESHIPKRHRQAGVTLAHLTQSAEEVHEAGNPLKDSVVLNRALAIVEFEKSPAHRIWQNMIPDLKRRLYESAWHMWLKPVRSAGLQDGVLILTAPGPIRTWVERRYIDVIVECLPDDVEITGVRFR